MNEWLECLRIGVVLLIAALVYIAIRESTRKD